MRTAISVLAVIFFAACGPASPSSPDCGECLSQDWYGRWEGPAHVQIGSAVALDLPMDVGVSIDGTTAYLDQLCPRWHSKAVGSGSGGAIEWVGTLVCVEAPVGGCDHAILTFQQASLNLIDDAHVTGSFSGLVSGCDVRDAPFRAKWSAVRE